MAVQKFSVPLLLSLAALAAPPILLAHSGDQTESHSPDANRRPNLTPVDGQSSESLGASSAVTGLSTIPIDTAMTPEKLASYKATPDMLVSHHAGFNTPESDGRPGDYFFYLGEMASQKHDYEHAIMMYKVAASWAHKPAEYNLGVLYLSGHGSPVDLPRAMAWFALAAERGGTQFVYAKQLLYTRLTPEQFERANEIWRELLPTYGDAVSLVRAKARWREVRYSATGSRVGSAAMPLRGMSPNFGSGKNIDGMEQTDGSIAYQQLRATDNPYDAAGTSRPLSGTVTVGNLTPMKSDDPGAQKSPANGTPPQQPTLQQPPSQQP